MRISHVARAMLVLASCASAASAGAASISAAVRSAQVVTLEDAYQHVLQTHPDLQVWRHTLAGLEFEKRRALLAPALNAELEIENVLGTGTASGVQSAELTLSLASVLERGGKREARQLLAGRHFDVAALNLEAARLDLFAEVARRYLDLLAAQALERLAVADVGQRRRALDAADRRVAAGASPESVRLSADAALAAASMAQAQHALGVGAARRRLAMLWNDESGQAFSASGDLLHIPAVPDLAALAQMLERTPELQRFATEKRLREARLQLARSGAATDLHWQVGVRRLQAEGDWAVVAGVSVPLGSRGRAALDAGQAAAQVEGLGAERESRRMLLYATLAQAQSQLASAVAEVDGLRDEVLPRWSRADAAAERAFRSGAASYLDWALVQAEANAARQAQLRAAIDAHRALLELQRLTADPFLAPGAARPQDFIP